MPETGEHTNREALLKLYQILQTGDVERLDEVMTEDCVTDYPQSGERLSGRDNIAAMIANYPGGPLEPDTESALVVGDEEHYVMTPTFNVVRVQGGGDTLVGTLKTRYPDGSVWHIISIAHFHDGRIARAQQYFAPEFEPPEWRSQWAERM